MSDGRRRAAALLAPLALPWTVVVTRVGVEFVFPWGLANLYPWPHVVPITTYLLTYTRGLPAYLRAWPLSVVVYACALATSVGSWAEARATASLLLVAGAGHLAVSVGIWSAGDGRLALPTGTVLLWAAAWYWFATDRTT